MRKNRFPYLLAVLAGCSADSTQPETLLSSTADVTACSGSRVGQTIYAPGFIMNWPCGAVTIKSASATDAELDQAIESAAKVWADALPTYSAVAGVPRLRRVAPNEAAMVVVSRTGSGGEWCGATPSKSQVLLIKKATGTCPTHWSSSLHDVLVHEFAHVLGFQASWHDAAAPANCVIRLVAGSPINTSPCQHELEMLYGAYGFTSLNIETFFGQQVLTGVTLSPASQSIVAGTSGTVSASSTHRRRQMLPNLQGGVSLTWAAESGLSLGTQSNSGAAITGAAIGTWKVRARVSGTSLPNARIGTLARLVGDSATVTVTAAPPPPTAPFKVTDITGPPTPITQAGEYSFNATVTGNPLGYLFVYWHVTFSNGQTPSVTQTSNTLKVRVPEGSYVIRLTARPWNGETYGFQLIEEFPVCTGGSGGGGGGGGQLRVAPKGPPGSVTPSAVLGC
jgi:hypothetical protein